MQLQAKSNIDRSLTVQLAARVQPARLIEHRAPVSCRWDVCTRQQDEGQIRRDSKGKSRTWKISVMLVVAQFDLEFWRLKRRLILVPQSCFNRWGWTEERKWAELGVLERNLHTKRRFQSGD